MQTIIYAIKDQLQTVTLLFILMSERVTFESHTVSFRFDIRTRKLANTLHTEQCCLFAILSTEELRMCCNIAYNDRKARQFRIL
jgi:hypothetical protein